MKIMDRNVPMSVQIREECGETITKKEAIRCFGLLEDNRMIDSKRVELFVELIEEGCYYNQYPVICYEASNLADLGKKITDLNGNTILEEKIKDYLIIVDGQHRVIAFINYNEKNEKTKKIVPNVNIVNADSAKDVLKFLVNINTAGKDWNDSDRWNIARNLNNVSVNKINVLIKQYEFNHSTAQKIYLGRRLSKKEFSSLLNGNFENIEDIIENENIENGDTFINICLQISGEDKKKMKLFAKRYFIDGLLEFSKGKPYKNVFDVMRKMKYDELKKVKSTDDFIKMLNKSK